MFHLNGKRINIDAAYTDKDGVTYSNLRDAAVRGKIGVTEIADPIRKNDQFYYVTEQETSPFVSNTPKPKEQIVSMLWQKIKAHRDSLIFNGGAKVNVDGVDKWFHSDTHSKLQQSNLKALGDQLPANLPWKTMDGSFVILTPAILTEVFQAQLAQEMSIFAHAEALKVQIEALAEPTDNADEFEQFDIYANWPATYQGAV